MGCVAPVIPGFEEPLIPQEKAQPLIINPLYVTKQQIMLNMKHKICFSGADLKVYEMPTTVEKIRVSGKLFFTQISFKNMNDQLLCKLKKSMKLEDAQGTIIAVIQRDFGYTSDGMDRLTLTRCSDAKVIYTIEGSFNRCQFVIRNEFDEIVSRTGPKLVEKTGFFKNNYGLEITAGVDMLLMICLCSAIYKFICDQQQNVM